MKKIKILIISIFTLFVLPLAVKAASGTISVSSSSKIVVGNQVSVTVTLTGDTNIGAWDMILDYDKSYLNLVSSSSGNGARMLGYIANKDDAIRKKTYTFKFKALKTGSTNLSIVAYSALTVDEQEINITTSNKTISIITQQELEASYSKNNDLKSLTVEGFEITPAFNKDTLEYQVIVPEGTKEINIGAQVSDSRAHVSGTGTQAVTEGTNSFPIVVKAENGSEKTYTLTVEVKDEHPINDKVGNKNYTVVKLRENLPTNVYYQEYSLKINDFDIPAYKSASTKLVLVGLKDESGKITLFTYDEKTKKYGTYIEIGTNKNTVYPLESTKAPVGYKQDTLKINGEEVTVYRYQEKSDFVIIYGVDIETGHKGYFLYDTKNQTIMRYNDEYITDLQAKNDLFKMIIYGFLGLFVILFIILIKLGKRKKGPKKEKPAKTKLTKKKAKKQVKDDFDF